MAHFWLPKLTHTVEMFPRMSKEFLSKQLQSTGLRSNFSERVSHFTQELSLESTRVTIQRGRWATQRS